MCCQNTHPSSPQTSSLVVDATKVRPRSCKDGARQQEIPSDNVESPSSAVQLGTKVIIATKLEHPLDNLQQRIYNWIRISAKQDIFVINAETVNIHGKDDDEKNLERAMEDCFQSYRLGSLNTFAFTAIRLFYCILPDDPDQAPHPQLQKAIRTKSLSALAEEIVAQDIDSSGSDIARTNTMVTFNIVRKDQTSRKKSLVGDSIGFNRSTNMTTPAAGNGHRRSRLKHQTTVDLVELNIQAKHLSPKSSGIDEMVGTNRHRRADRRPSDSTLDHLQLQHHFDKSTRAVPPSSAPSK